MLHQLATDADVHGVVPIALTVLTRVGRMMKRASKRLLERMSNIYKQLQETFRAMRVVKAFTERGLRATPVPGRDADYYVKAMRVVNLDAATSPVIELFGVIGVSFALLSGAYLVISGEKSIFGVNMADATDRHADAPPALRAAGGDRRPGAEALQRLHKTSVGGRRGGPDLLRTGHEAAVGSNSRGPVLTRHGQEIEFRDVCFAYDPGRPTLAHINLTVRFGETIALVGKNGCGKSTLVGLLPRFYDPRLRLRIGRRHRHSPRPVAQPAAAGRARDAGHRPVR